MSPSRLIHSSSGCDHPVDARPHAGGIGGLPRASCLRSAGGRLSHHSGGDVLSGRQSRGDGVVRHRSVGAPVRPSPGLSQMTSTSSLGSSIITLQFNLDQNIDIAEQQVQAAINAATTFLPRDLPNPPIYSKVNPADSPILTLALTSDTLPLIESAGSGRYCVGAKNFSASRRRTGFDQRRAEACRPHSGQPYGAGFLRIESGRSAHRDRARPM